MLWFGHIKAPLSSYGTWHVKGFIDRCLPRRRYYLLDYKSNWLGEDSSAYTQAMAAAMQAHRYDLAISLYAQLLRICAIVLLITTERHFGGVIYLFLRGVDKEHPQQGSTRPDPTPG